MDKRRRTSSESVQGGHKGNLFLRESQVFGQPKRLVPLADRRRALDEFIRAKELSPRSSFPSTHVIEQEENPTDDVKAKVPKLREGNSSKLLSILQVAGTKNAIGNGYNLQHFNILSMGPLGPMRLSDHQRKVVDTLNYQFRVQDLEGNLVKILRQLILAIQDLQITEVWI